MTTQTRGLLYSERLFSCGTAYCVTQSGAKWSFSSVLLCLHDMFLGIRGTHARAVVEISLRILKFSQVGKEECPLHVSNKFCSEEN